LKELQKKTYFCLGEANIGRGSVSVSSQCVVEMDRELPCTNVRLLERQSSSPPTLGRKHVAGGAAFFV